jgi:hypothetical protein
MNEVCYGISLSYISVGLSVSCTSEKLASDGSG